MYNKIFGNKKEKEQMDQPSHMPHFFVFRQNPIERATSKESENSQPLC